MTKTTLDTAPSLLSSRRQYYAAYKIGMTDEWLDTKLLEFQR